jgi:GNAT superfamily N-acetyltransferase
MLTICHATEADIPLLRTLCFQVWPQTYAGIITQAQIDYMLEMMYSPASLQQQMHSGANFLICYDDTQPCGFASYQDHTNGKFKLDKIYVLPSQQGKGAGRYIIDYIVNTYSNINITFFFIIIIIIIIKEITAKINWG